MALSTMVSTPTRVLRIRMLSITALKMYLSVQEKINPLKPEKS